MFFCEAAKINMDIIPSLNDLMQQGQDTADELVANHSNHRSRSSRVSSWVRRKSAEKGQTQGVGWRGLAWLGVAWEDWEGRWRMKHD